MAKVFNWFVNFVFIVIIVVLLGYFALRITNKIEIYNVKTGSMEDKIHAGDYILIYRKSNYNIGDVITFRKEEGFITHRIIKKNGSTIITKGDANNTEDDEIDDSVIEGKVVLSGGVLNVIINYKYAIVGILLSLYLFSCYFGDGKDDRKSNEDNNELEDKEEINEKDNRSDAISLNDEIKLEEQNIAAKEDDFEKEIVKEDEIIPPSEKKQNNEQNEDNLLKKKKKNSNKDVDELMPIKKKTVKKTSNKNGTAKKSSSKRKTDNKRKTNDVNNNLKSTNNLRKTSSKRSNKK